MPKYVVLRNAAAFRSASQFQSFGPAIPAAPVEAAPRVELHDISVGEAATLANDLQVGAVAIPMLITLIKRIDVGAAAAVDNAWGIPAVKADASAVTGDATSTARRMG